MEAYTQKGPLSRRRREVVCSTISDGMSREQPGYGDGRWRCARDMEMGLRALRIRIQNRWSSLSRHPQALIRGAQELPRQDPCSPRPPCRQSSQEERLQEGRRLGRYPSEPGLEPKDRWADWEELTAPLAGVPQISGQRPCQRRQEERRLCRPRGPSRGHEELK